MGGRGARGAVGERGGPEMSRSSEGEPGRQDDGTGGLIGDSERGGRDEDAEVRGDQLAEEIRLEEVRNVVRQASRSKAVGDDGMPNKFLKEGGEIVMARTEQLFNVVREEEYVPKVWRVGDSVLLEKGGTGRIWIIIEGLHYIVVWGSCMEKYWGIGCVQRLGGGGVGGVGVGGVGGWGWGGGGGVGGGWGGGGWGGT